VSKKSKSRQTRRYSSPSRPKGGGAKGGTWRKMGSKRQRSATWPWALALSIVIAGGVALIALGGGSTSSSSSSSGSGSNGPLLATVASFDNGSPGPNTTVDGIKCETSEQLLFHVHSHLAIFVDGHQRSIPMGIGIAPPRQTEAGATGSFVVAGTCFYWLHAHTSDGIIHIESPIQRTYTLGNYFDIWRQPLGPNQVGPAHGKVTAYRNGQLFTGNPRNITIGAHIVIQLDVGTNVPFKNFTAWDGL
jgi:hypothetical protein